MSAHLTQTNQHRSDLHLIGRFMGKARGKMSLRRISRSALAAVAAIVIESVPSIAIGPKEVYGNGSLWFQV